ncbi:hypothetical protein BG58_33250 [Caballeronia jiangsuensis]|nr:hypothetical protein BG58_33250 [Caballeronia jiangsuensis]
MVRLRFGSGLPKVRLLYPARVFGWTRQYTCNLARVRTLMLFPLRDLDDRLAVDLVTQNQVRLIEQNQTLVNLGFAKVGIVWKQVNLDAPRTILKSSFTISECQKTREHQAGKIRHMPERFVTKELGFEQASASHSTIPRPVQSAVANKTDNRIRPRPHARYA